MKVERVRLVFRAVVISALLLGLAHGNAEHGGGGEVEEHQQVDHRDDVASREEERNRPYQEEKHAAPSNVEVPKMHAQYSFRPPFKNFTVQGDRYIPGWTIGEYCKDNVRCV